MTFDETPVFRALVASRAARRRALDQHGPAGGGRHRWREPPPAEPPTAPIEMEAPVPLPDDPHSPDRRATDDAPSASAGAVPGLRVEVLPTTATMKRHVVHDDRSRRYALPSPGRAAPRSVYWPRRGPVYDQSLLNGGEGLGCCTMCTGFGLLMTDPYAAPGREFTMDDVLGGYVQETALDDEHFPGRWPPDDTGSAGLWMAKVLQNRGLIGGYRHAFGTAAALAALQTGPLAVGTVWLESMNTPDHLGVLAVDPSSPVIGGHEYIVDEYIADERVPGGGWVGKHGSWGEGWGVRGRAYMTAADFDWLLRQNGDVIQLFRYMDGPR